LSVFDTFVSSVINYASEVWRFHQAPEVEKTQNIDTKQSNKRNNQNSKDKRQDYHTK